MQMSKLRFFYIYICYAQCIETFISKQKPLKNVLHGIKTYNQKRLKYKYIAYILKKKRHLYFFKTIFDEFD